MMFFSLSERQVVLFEIETIQSQFLLPIELIARINPLVSDQISVTLIISPEMGSSRAHPWRRTAKNGTVGVAVGENHVQFGKLKHGESIEGFIFQKLEALGQVVGFISQKKPQVGLRVGFISQKKPQVGLRVGTISPKKP